MSFQFEERPDSRSSTDEPPSHTRIYKAVGEQDDAIVKAYAAALVPTAVSTTEGILYRQGIRIDPDGWAQYVVSTTYGPRKKETGDFTFSFDTTGGTITVKAGKAHVASYPGDAGPANPHKGLIGVTGKGDVEGAEMIIPALKITYGFRHPQGVVDESFARTLARNTGKVNSDSWRGFDAGELLFIGASGSDGSEADAEVSYQFAASENATLTIGEIADVVKKGHEALWIEYEDDEEDDEAVQIPKRIHIERVYSDMSFASIFGWS